MSKIKIKELVKKLEHYTSSPYEIGDRYSDRVELYTRDVEFDSREEYVLVNTSSSST